MFQIAKMVWKLLYKDSLSSDSQQLHQYEQNEQELLTL